MKAEREKINAKVKADTVRLNGSKLELTADEEMCTFLLVSEGSCTLQMGENSLLLNPGSALLLGAGDAVLTAANLGEDADTTAAIAGQLAGALYGAAAIPAAWRAKLAWHDRIIGAAEALLAPEIAHAA